MFGFLQTVCARPDFQFGELVAYFRLIIGFLDLRIWYAVKNNLVSFVERIAYQYLRVHG